MAKRKTEDKTIDILKLETGTLDVCLLGTKGIILNRMSEKAKHELWMPRKKTAADRAGLKHDPLAEFRAAPYTLRDDSSPTYLAILATALKSSLRNAALVVPGAKKTEIGRLTWINAEYVGVFGIPKIIISVTRSADMNRTPDIRTRCIIPHWALRFKIEYVMPHLTHTIVAQLLAAAGLTMGLGDWRPEKGSGNYGQFTIVDPTDEVFQEIVTTGGRAAQIAAMQQPECYDAESEEMLAWFESETRRRGISVVGG